ncbi:MAG TPA: SDR family NAD(P)-dependent oxidoreductase [Burkholderiaceae bacterium]
MRQRVLVTGASRGLGAALAREFCKRGHRVFLVARDAEDLAQLAAEITRSQRAGAATWRAHDLRDVESTEALARAAEHALGGIDILVNNAAIGPYRPFLDNSTQDLHELLALNLEAPMQLTHALLPGMLERGSGHVINIASDLARRPLAQMAPYVASKHGLLGFGASLHREVRGRGVRVTTVMPGVIDSSFNGSVEGSRDQRWALPTAALAQQVVDLSELPATMVVDELVVHPADGDY